MKNEKSKKQHGMANLKITMGEPVPVETIRKASERWKDVIKKLPDIPAGMALPVELGEYKYASALQYYILATNSRHDGGRKYACRRIGTTVYISKAEDAEPWREA